METRLRACLGGNSQIGLHIKCSDLHSCKIIPDVLVMVVVVVVLMMS